MPGEIIEAIGSIWVILMADNEKTSDQMAKIASQAMRDPKSLTLGQIKSLGASNLTQAKDLPKSAPKPPAKPKR